MKLYFLILIIFLIQIINKVKATDNDISLLEDEFLIVTKGVTRVKRQNTISITKLTSETSGMPEETSTTVSQNITSTTEDTSLSSEIMSTTTEEKLSTLTVTSIQSSTTTTTLATVTTTSTSITTTTTTTTTTPLTTTTSTTTTTTTTTTTRTTIPTTISTIITTSTLSTTTTTRPTLESTWFEGSNDLSIKSSVVNSQNGNLIDIESNPILFVSKIYSSFNVHQNGFITLGTEGTSFARSLPFQNLKAVKIPLIAPFWTDLYYDSLSDIKVGLYEKEKLSSEQFLDSLKTDLKFYSKSIFSPESIIIISWKNVLPVQNSLERASFQLIIAQNYTENKNYLIFNYDKRKFNWTDNNKIILISYTNVDQVLQGGVALYSNTIDRTVIPYDIFTAFGNTNKMGSFAYDVSYFVNDPCESWYLKSLKKKQRTQLQDSLKNKKYISCPFTIDQVESNSQFSYINNGFWQQDVKCYEISDILLNKNPQHLCCYKKTTKSLENEGFNAGFMYYNNEDLISITQGGYSCCMDNNWDKCKKFYSIYPKNTVENYKIPKTSFCAGDPQIQTFDGLSYTFNGLGQYILTKTRDGSFEVQIETSIFQNVDDSNISGTFTTSIAVKTSTSPIVEIKLIDYNKINPYIVLYIDRVRQNDFTTNLNYEQNFPPSNQTVKIKKEKNGATIIYDNGISIQITITTIDLNQFNKISWIVFNINLNNDLVTLFKNQLVGLMGNFNDDKNDDIISRKGLRPINMTLERSIFPIASTWAILPTETVLITKDTSIQSRDLINTNFVPTFSEDIVFSDSIKTSCNSVLSCMIDASLTGVKDIGGSTLNSVQTQQRSIKIASNRPPFIQFRESTIKIDISQQVIKTIIVDVFDLDIDDAITSINITASGTNSYTINPSNPNLFTSSSTFSIIYTPKKDEYPIFSIIATDKNLASNINSTNIEICNCKELDSQNQCLFGTRLIAVNPSVTIVKCSCTQYYTGDFCNQTIDYCSTSKPCDAITSDYNITYTCTNFPINEQKLFNKTYYCNGNCPNSIGFFKTTTGFCQDINECLTPTSCPINSICVNTIGSYYCKCPIGYTYVNNNCQDIDECSISNLNSCESKCVNTIGSYYCECDFGFKINNFTQCVKDSAINIPGCNTLNCAQICTVDSNNNNNVFCKCRIGFQLASDSKTCIDIDECATKTSGCTDTCTNTIGSFYCSCQIGKILDTDKLTCNRCPFNKYGENCLNTCDCVNAVECNPVKGCVCKSGWTGQFCENDIDECAILTSISYQTYNSYCINTPGSFIFLCISNGFIRRNESDYNCYDIDECKSPNRCPINANCRNTIGSFECICDSGLKYEQNNCVDINECLNQNQCPINSYCSNFYGGYECNCNTGFSKTSDSPALIPKCLDINECLNPLTCRYNENCLNTVGSYSCSCKLGYLYIQENNTCVDINECDQNPCSINETCKNTDGSYSCECKPYYKPVNGKCLFQERATNELQFQLSFKNIDCASVNNIFLANISSTVKTLYSSQNLAVNTTATRINCLNNTATIQITVSFSDSSLKPKQETNAVLLMSKLSGSFESVALLSGLTPILLNSTDQCFVYKTYQICLNGGFCTVINNEPTCECPSYSKFILTGTYCEIKTLILTTPSTTTKAITNDNTLLIIEIVLPIIAFIIILILTMIIVYYCYKRKMYAYSNQQNDKERLDETTRQPKFFNLFSKNNKSNIKKNLDNTDFEFERTNNLIDLNYELDNKITKQEYRPTYPLENSSIVPDVDFLHSLEINASRRQTSTIVRPNSTFSDFSNTLPTAYHEKTTPYSDFNNIIDDPLDPFQEHDMDDDFSEVIEAINPNVKIPRPRIQKKPLSLFK